MVDQGVLVLCYDFMRVDTWVYLIFLNMVDFDIILVMDWLSPYLTILDYHINTITMVILCVLL